MRKKKGTLVREMKFDITLEWGARPARAQYTIRDTSNRDLEKMTVTRDADGTQVFQYEAGFPLAARPTPEITWPIQGSDLSWADLTFAFLWWEHPRVVKKDSVRGRDCVVLEVLRPDVPPVMPGTRSDPAAVFPYSKMRLWVDQKACMLLQAEGYDAQDRLVCRSWVKSFKKTDETWMIKDMEIERYPVIHRTKFSIREVSSDIQP